MNNANPALVTTTPEDVRAAAYQRLQSVVQALHMSLHEIQQYHDKFADACCDSERADLMNWTVQYLVYCAVPNLRIDLLADSQSELYGLAKD
jgi:hypothetical protein